MTHNGQSSACQLLLLLRWHQAAWLLQLFAVHSRLHHFLQSYHI